MKRIFAAEAAVLLAEAAILAGIAAARGVLALRGPERRKSSGDAGGEPEWQRGFDQMMRYDLTEARRAARRELEHEE